MALINIKNLSIYTKNQTQKLVNDISFTLKRGSITGLVGESGSGKSLTALSVMQLLPESLEATGEINFYEPDGEPFQLHKASQKALMAYRGKKAAMIFQDPMSSLNPSQKTGAQVAEAAMLHQQTSRKNVRKQVLEKFNLVRLPEPERIFHSYPFQLSGGQRQRVMIAMALINNPSLLIADEATTALDVTVQHEIIKLIQELQQKLRLTVLFITHDLTLLKGFADRVMVMQNGKIVEQGTREQIMEHPENDYTKALLACRPGQVLRAYKLPVIADFKTDGSFIFQKRSVSVPTSTAILNVQDLEVHYRLRQGDFFRALGDINFPTYRGETLGIVGESGCGKTTLSKAILQIIPYKGQILLDNEPLAYRNKKEELKFRKKVQFVFQDPYSSLNPSIKVGNSIREVLKVHKIKNRVKRVEELLLQVGLDAGFATRYPHELSGGQRQRVAIARALATEPDLLILDEAVAALDVSVQAKVLNLLNELKATLGLTYIFISHDLEVVHYMADRIMVIKDGHIVEAGPSDDVFEKPASAYTKKLIAASPGK